MAPRPVLGCVLDRMGAPAPDLEPRSPQRRDSCRIGAVEKEGFTQTQMRPGRGFVESEASWALRRKQKNCRLSRWPWDAWLL